MLFDIVLHKKPPSFGSDIMSRSGVRRLVVVGPSGSGKSLALQLLAGLLKPGDGYIRVDNGIQFNERINLPTQERRAGLLFRDYALLPHLTVARNINFGLAHGLSNPSKRLSEKARCWLEMLRLERVAGHYPQQISGEQKQCIALARVSVTEPELLLLDEPFSALNADLRTHTCNEVLQIQQTSDIPMILITHDKADAEMLADEIWAMEAGRLATAGVNTGQYRLRPYRP